MVSLQAICLVVAVGLNTAELMDVLADKLVDRALHASPTLNDLEAVTLAKLLPVSSRSSLHMRSTLSMPRVTAPRSSFPVTHSSFSAPRALPASITQSAQSQRQPVPPLYNTKAASARNVAAQASKPVVRAEGKNPVAVMDTTMGTFKAELFLDKMPITVSSFVDLAKKGYFDGIHFHRVIPNFMDQFGCPFAKDPASPRAGTGGPDGGSTFENLATGDTITRDAGGNIPDEFAAKIPNDTGTLSMANTGRPNSGGSQFFINVNNNNFLDWFDDQTPSKHPVFGKVIENMELAVKISEVPTQQDRPITPIKMNSIKIEM